MAALYHLLQILVHTRWQHFLTTRRRLHEFAPGGSTSPPNLHQMSGLVGDIDGDGFALGVVEALHRVDAGDHVDAIDEDGDEEQRDNDARPDRDGEEADTVILSPKLDGLDWLPVLYLETGEC